MTQLFARILCKSTLLAWIKWINILALQKNFFFFFFLNLIRANSLIILVKFTLYENAIYIYIYMQTIFDKKYIDLLREVLSLMFSSELKENPIRYDVILSLR